MPRSTQPARVALPVGRFVVDRFDGWWDTVYLDDELDEDSVLEIGADGCGSFRAGDLEGTFRLGPGLRGRWVGGFCEEPLEGSISVSELHLGLLMAELKVRGEEPWFVEARVPEGH